MSAYQIQRQNEDGEWVPADSIPFHYGLLPRIARWFTHGRWPK